MVTFTEAREKELLSEARRKAAFDANVDPNQPVMSARQPSLREDMSGLISQLLMAMGRPGGERGNYQYAKNNVMPLAEMTGIGGMATALGDAAQAQDGGDVQEAILNLMPGPNFGKHIPGTEPFAKSWDVVPDDPLSVTEKNAKKQVQDPEFYHKAGGGAKMTKPLSELSYKTVPTGGTPLPPQQQIQPEDLLGKTGMALIGDKTRAGETLTEVGGRELTNPQELHGGYRFMDEFPGSTWAASQGEMEEIIKKAKAEQERSGREMVGFPVAMGPNSGNSARMMTNPILDLMGQNWNDIPQEAKDTLNTAMTALTTNKRGATSWPGLEAAVKEPTWADTAPGTDRAALAKELSKPEYQKPGYFPNTAELTQAVTAPDLFNRPSLTTGMSTGKLDLSGSGINENPLKQHNTYPAQSAGTSTGRLGMLPYDMVFQKFAGSRPPGEQIPHTMRTILTQKPFQEFDDEWLENFYRMYEERQPR